MIEPKKLPLAEAEKQFKTFARRAQRGKWTRWAYIADQLPPSEALLFSLKYREGQSAIACLHAAKKRGTLNFTIHSTSSKEADYCKILLKKNGVAFKGTRTKGNTSVLREEPSESQ